LVLWPRGSMSFLDQEARVHDPQEVQV
jgi:hypothetical protein